MEYHLTKKGRNRLLFYSFVSIAIIAWIIRTIIGWFTLIIGIIIYGDKIPVYFGNIALVLMIITTIVGISFITHRYRKIVPNYVFSLTEEGLSVPEQLLPTFWGGRNILLENILKVEVHRKTIKLIAIMYNKFRKLKPSFRK